MKRPYNWYLDETTSAGRENLDAGHVSRYDDKEDAVAANELKLLKELGLTDTSVIVDIGAGTGQFTVAAAETGALVIAVDVSSLMLERLNEKVTKLKLANVELVQSGFLTYEHNGRPVDFVYSRLALHHLPDFWKALALERMRRMVRKGGILRLWDVIYDFDPPEAEERIEAWCATAGDDASGRKWNRSDYEEHIRDEYSTFRWLLEPMIERCGFEIIDVDYTPDGIFGKYIARAR
ncbi:MAG: class I SAM-dependent methyltransferase [Balneolales bacterium]